MAASYEWEVAKSNMRMLRKKANMKQKDLGKELGVDRNIICTYEKGKHVPRIDYIQKFCVYFGIGIDDLYDPDLIEGVLGL